VSVFRVHQRLEVYYCGPHHGEGLTAGHLSLCIVAVSADCREFNAEPAADQVVN
jgi:hypothetical protein